MWNLKNKTIVISGATNGIGKLRPLSCLKKILSYCLPIEIKILQTNFLLKLKPFPQILKFNQCIVIFPNKIPLKNVSMKLMICVGILMYSSIMLVL